MLSKLHRKQNTFAFHLAFDILFSSNCVGRLQIHFSRAWKQICPLRPLCLPLGNSHVGSEWIEETYESLDHAGQSFSIKIPSQMPKMTKMTESTSTQNKTVSRQLLLNS